MQGTYRYMVLDTLELGFYDIVWVILNAISIFSLWRFPLFLWAEIKGQFITKEMKEDYFYAKHRLIYKAWLAFKLSFGQMISDIPYIPLLPLNILAFWRGIEWCVKYYNYKKSTTIQE
jgi:uncharacterized membrane protein